MCSNLLKSSVLWGFLFLEQHLKAVKRFQCSAVMVAACSRLRNRTIVISAGESVLYFMYVHIFKWKRPFLKPPKIQNKALLLFLVLYLCRGFQWPIIPAAHVNVSFVHTSFLPIILLSSNVSFLHNYVFLWALTSLSCFRFKGTTMKRPNIEFGFCAQKHVLHSRCIEAHLTCIRHSL